MVHQSPDEPLYYQLEVKGPNGVVSKRRVVSNRAVIKVPPGTFTVRVRAVDKWGNKSNWSKTSHHRRGSALEVNWSPEVSVYEVQEEYDLFVGEYGTPWDGCGFPMHLIELFIETEEEAA